MTMYSSLGVCTDIFPRPKAGISKQFQKNSIKCSSINAMIHKARYVKPNGNEKM